MDKLQNNEIESKERQKKKTVKVSGKKIKPLYGGKMCERQAKMNQQVPQTDIACELNHKPFILTSLINGFSETAMEPQLYLRNNNNICSKHSWKLVHGL